MMTRKSIDTIQLSVAADKLSRREWVWIKLMEPMAPPPDIRKRHTGAPQRYSCPHPPAGRQGLIFHVVSSFSPAHSKNCSQQTSAGRLSSTPAAYAISKSKPSPAAASMSTESGRKSIRFIDLTARISLSKNLSLRSEPT